MADWTFSESAHRYRDAASGRFISATTERALRDDFLARRQEAMRALTGRVTAGEVSVQSWVRTMRSEIQQTTTAQYAFGRGGINAVTAADRAAIAQLSRVQYPYLQKFAEEVRAGRLTPAQAQARAEMYARSAVGAHGRGQAAALGIELPAYPAVGTDCRANCQCEWEIEEDDDEIRATWTLGADDNCDTCLERADLYSPYTIAKVRSEAA